jgi:hypothetical protein
MMARTDRRTILLHTVADYHVYLVAFKSIVTPVPLSLLSLDIGEVMYGFPFFVYSGSITRLDAIYK